MPSAFEDREVSKDSTPWPWPVRCTSVCCSLARLARCVPASQAASCDRVVLGNLPPPMRAPGRRWDPDFDSAARFVMSPPIRGAGVAAKLKVSDQTSRSVQGTLPALCTRVCPLSQKPVVHQFSSTRGVLYQFPRQRLG